MSTHFRPERKFRPSRLNLTQRLSNSLKRTHMALYLPINNSRPTNPENDGN